MLFSSNDLYHTILHLKDPKSKTDVFGSKFLLDQRFKAETAQHEELRPSCSLFYPVHD